MTTIPQRYYSSIYWHFTGSPAGIRWDVVTKPLDILAQGSLKTTQQSLDILLKILTSQCLKAFSAEKLSPSTATGPFCCVTDIPLKDLPSHAPYYGRVAVGFRPAAIHKAFLPVLYIPKRQVPRQEAKGYDGITRMMLRSDDPHGSRTQAFLDYALGSDSPFSDIDSAAVGTFLRNFLKITDFDVDPSNSFYREREWRHLGDFAFSTQDVAAIVCPDSHLDLVRTYVNKSQYPASVTLIAWEFLELA